MPNFRQATANAWRSAPRWARVLGRLAAGLLAALVILWLVLAWINWRIDASVAATGVTEAVMHAVEVEPGDDPPPPATQPNRKVPQRTPRPAPATRPASTITTRPADPPVALPFRIIDFNANITVLGLSADGRQAVVRITRVVRSLPAVVIWYSPLIVMLGSAPAFVLIFTGHSRAGRFRRQPRGVPPGEPYCVKCEYQLTGATSTTCPECGAAITGAGRAIVQPPNWGRRVRTAAWYLVPLCLFLFGASAVNRDGTHDFLHHVIDWSTYGPQFDLPATEFSDGFAVTMHRRERFAVVDLTNGRILTDVASCRNTFTQTTAQFLSHDGSKLLLYREDLMCLIDVATGREVARIRPNATGEWDLQPYSRAPVFRTDDQRVVFFTKDSWRLLEWDWRGGVLTHGADLQPPSRSSSEPSVESAPVRLDTTSRTFIAAAPDGEVLLAAMTYRQNHYIPRHSAVIANPGGIHQTWPISDSRTQARDIHRFSFITAQSTDASGKFDHTRLTAFTADSLSVPGSAWRTESINLPNDFSFASQIRRDQHVFILARIRDANLYTSEMIFMAWNLNDHQRLLLFHGHPATQSRFWSLNPIHLSQDGHTAALDGIRIKPNLTGPEDLQTSIAVMDVSQCR